MVLDLVRNFLNSNFFIYYIEDIYQTLLRNLKRPAKLNEATDELIAMTPKPMNTMLEKQSKPDAIQKLLGRRALVNMSVPPTTPGIHFIFHL